MVWINMALGGHCVCMVCEYLCVVCVCVCMCVQVCMCVRDSAVYNSVVFPTLTTLTTPIEC